MLLHWRRGAYADADAAAYEAGLADATALAAAGVCVADDWVGCPQ